MRTLGAVLALFLGLSANQRALAGVPPFVDCNSNGTDDSVELSAGGSTSAAAVDVPQAIPDNQAQAGQGAASVIPVASALFVADVNCRLSIRHTFDGDLDILLAHAGLTRTLSDDNGGGGDNYANTLFDDEAAGAITAAAAPYTGTFRPEQALSAFDHARVSGAWTLTARDDAGLDTGTLLSWSLVIATQTANDCNTNGTPDACDGDCDTNGFADVCELAGGAADCNSNGAPDACEVNPAQPDCNTNGRIDVCDVARGSTDCNTNGLPDRCDLAVIGSDCDSNGTLDVCHAGQAAAALSAAPVLPILDLQSTASSVVSPLSGLLSGVSVSVSLLHTWDSDLRIELRRSGSLPVLLSANRGLDGDHFVATVFSDSAGQSISAGTPPFTGTFRPEQPLASYVGGSAGGVWTLSVRDIVNQDTGTLLSWSLFLSHPTADCDTNGQVDLCELPGGDCNTNATRDACDVAVGAPDCNTNGRPDACDGADCNTNAVADACELAGHDCNGNATLDACDVVGGAADCNTNSVPDGCEGDCDTNGAIDACESAPPLDAAGNAGAADCNTNGVHDVCDLAAVAAWDCDTNGLIDACELGGATDCNTNATVDACESVADCDANGVADACDVASDALRDCNTNGTPDACDAAGTDCNTNGVVDVCEATDCDRDGTPNGCEIAAGARDCNSNDVPDVCEPDCDTNGTADECEPYQPDCDANGIPDVCESDCNTNGVNDRCDVAAADSPDCDQDGRPDECQEWRGDMNGDGRLRGDDIQAFVNCYFNNSTQGTCAKSDMNSDGQSTVVDVQVFAGEAVHTTGCPPSDGCKVDLGIDSDNDGHTPDDIPQDDPIEMNEPGKFIAVNNDDDNTNGVRDMDEATATAGENDLRMLILSTTCGTPGHWKLEYDSKRVKVWFSATRGTPIDVVDPQREYDLPPPPQLWAEGLSPCTSEKGGDVQFTLRVEGANGKGHDEVLATIVQVDFVHDTNTNLKADPEEEAALFVRIGLWDHAFNGAASLLNTASESNNFVGSDSRRFYFRVTDAHANTNAGSSEDIHNGFRWKTSDDAPTNRKLSLKETSAKSATFTSSAVMIVTDVDDEEQHTRISSGDDPADNPGHGQDNHRLRRINIFGSSHRLNQTVTAEYDANTDSTGSRVSLTIPLFCRSKDERHKLPVQMYVMQFPPQTGCPNPPTDPGAPLWTLDLRNIREIYARMGIEVYTAVGPGVDPADVCTSGLDSAVKITAPPGVNPCEIREDGLKRISASLPRIDANTNTIQLVIVGDLNIPIEGGTGYVRGVSFATFFNWSDGRAGCAFVGFQRRHPFTAAHEIGHILTNKANNSGHYLHAANMPLLHDEHNLMEKTTSALEGVHGSKRLWDAADLHDINQYLSVRKSPFVRPY